MPLSGGTIGDGEARLRARLDRAITQIDALVSRQIDAILHHPAFQRLEGSWRGLAWLVAHVEPGPRLRIAVLSATWRDLERDLARAGEADRSELFRLIYEGEFGRAGGEPFGLLLVDHEVSHRPRPRDERAAPVDDLFVLGGLAQVAAAAFAPIVLGTSPTLLAVDDWADLTLSADIAGVLEDEDHLRWRTLAGREEMRFVCLALPRVLARPPWRAFPPRHGLAHEEDAPSARERTWFGAAWAFAATVARAQREHGWPADIRGVTLDRLGGGLVTGLPRETIRLGAVTTIDRPSVSLGLTDVQERALVAARLMPLNTLPFGEAAFASVQSLQTVPTAAPGREVTAALANRRVSAQINAMLCVSRFAHYVKVMGREMTGSLGTAEDIERRLQRWLSGYTNANQAQDADGRARWPLLSARVAVHEIEARPGTYACVIHLQPHHQLDDVATTFRLVTGFAAEAVAA